MSASSEPSSDGIRRESTFEQARTWTARAAAALCSLGIVHWLLLRPHLRTRGGYAELFYPPHPGPILTMIGLASLALWVLGSRSTTPRALRFLLVFGRASMLAYLLHVGIIGLWIRHVSTPGPLHQFLPIFLLLSASVLVFVVLVKRFVPARGWFGKLILGG
ncbi:MAG: hypothetical protein QM784_05200 [Polyangiaceae bacterium]